MASGNVSNGSATPGGGGGGGQHGGGGGGGGVAVITVVESSKDGNASQNRRQSTAAAAEARGSEGGGSSSAMAAGAGASGGGGAEGKLTVGRLSVASLCADFCIIIALGVAILLVKHLVEPHRRGFFCDDDSIRLPLRKETVSSLTLLLVGIAVPLLVVVTCEVVSARRQGPAARAARRVAVARVSVAAWVVRIVWTLTLFVFGLVAEDVVIEAAKFSMGRLRPHFLEVCMPSPSLATLCGGGGNASSPSSFLSRGASPLGGGIFSAVPFAAPDPHTYVEDYTCTGDASQVKEARLSFPSGHASMSFYSAIFTALYLQRRFRWRRRARLQLVFAQLVLALLAWLTALSRITDHKHHWSDVLAGAAIGAGAALLTVLFAALPPASRSSPGEGDDDDGRGDVGLAGGGAAGVGMRSAPSCDTYETLFVV